MRKPENLLQMLFICHRRPDRSFHCSNGKQFPICARCTGILAGYLLGIILAIMTGPIFVTYALLLLIPTVLDGFIQLLTNYESNNFKRLTTGILAGVGIVYIFAFIASSAMTHGIWLAKQFT